MRLTRGIAAAAASAVVAGAMFAGAATAEAACTGSTPSATAFTDPIDGDFGLAPELTTVRAGVDTTCHYVVDPGVPYPLVDGDGVFAYLDVDGNPATGSPVMHGADIAVGTVGFGTSVSPPMRGVWNGSTFTFTDPAPVGTSVGNGGFSASVDALPIASGATTNLVVGSIWVGLYASYFDVAPNAGVISLPVTYSTVAPAPAPAPVAAPAPRSTSTYTAQSPQPCTVPRTKGMTVDRARSRMSSQGCTVAAAPRRAYSATVRRGRVVGTSIAAGADAQGAVSLIVSKGKRPRKARKADAGSVLARANALVAADVRRHALGG
jgi:hypothetical protein